MFYLQIIYIFHSSLLCDPCAWEFLFKMWLFTFSLWSGWRACTVQDFRLSLQCIWCLRSSGLLQGVGCFVTRVSIECFDPMFSCEDVNLWPPFVNFSNWSWISWDDWCPVLWIISKILTVLFESFKPFEGMHARWNFVSVHNWEHFYVFP